MKRFYSIFTALLLTMGLQAQTLNVNIGNVTYAHSAAQTGDMQYSGNGSVLTIEGKAYTVSDLTSITIDNSTVGDSAVSVTYNGSSAKVVVSGDVAKYLTVAVSGADVSITAADDLATEITYTLSGSSSNGSFTQTGTYKATVAFDALSLTSTTGAPITINNGKRIKVKLTGTSTLADCANGVQNACFYCDGHTEFSGTGALNVTGNTKHGLTSDEYMEFKNATLNIVSAVGDGLHIGQYFEMKSGTITVNAQGDGIDVGAKKKTSENNGQVFITDGIVTITTTGTATKGLKADSLVTITGGTLTVTTSGNAYYDATAADISSASALKTNGAFTMSGGTVSLTSTGSGGKGLNVTEDIAVSGGQLTAVTTGSVFTYQTLDSKAQGVKTDGNITISDGTVLVAASSDKASAFKSGLLFRINGGNVMGIGNKKITPAASSQQKYSQYTGVSVKGSSTVTYNGVSFAIPAIYTNTAANILVSSPSI